MLKHRLKPRVNTSSANGVPTWKMTGVLVLSLLLGVWGELIPDGLPNKIDELTNSNYTLIWILTGTLLFAASVSIHFRQKKSLNSDEIDRNDQYEEINRRFSSTLKKIYQNRLRQKLDNRLEINLEYRYSKIGFANEEVKTLHYSEGMQSENEISADLAHIYNSHSYMVILGGPGSGKTSRLLDLAMGLVVQSELNSSELLPIVLNLAPWAEDGNFSEWIANAIVSMYGYPAKFVNRALDNNKIILLLDGFDEIGQNFGKEESQALRKATLKSIEKYISKKDAPKLVLCSRITEYEEALSKEWKYKIDAQFLIKTISEEKIRDTLEKSALGKHRKEARKLLSYFNDESTSREMKEVIATPFYFNAIMVILDNSDYDDLQFPSSSEAIKTYITRCYIEGRLKTNSKYQKYDSKRYLAWLAFWINKRRASTFDVSDFILKDQIKNLTFKILIGAFASLAIAFIVGLFKSLLLGIVFGLPIGLVFGLTTGVLLLMLHAMIHFFLGYDSDSYIWHGRLLTEDQWVLDFSQLKKIKTFLKILFNSLMLGILYGLVFGLIGGLIHKLSGGANSDLASGFINGLILSFIIGVVTTLHGNFVRGLIYGLVFGLVATVVVDDLTTREIAGSLLVNWNGASTAGWSIGSSIGLLEGIQRYSSKPVFFSHTNKPYQRLLSTWKKEMLLNISIILLLTLGFLIFFNEGTSYNLILAVSWTPIIAIISFFNTPMFQHLITNFLLQRQGKLPFPLVPFLRWCVQINLLEQDGGSWRFRHQIIQDYFVDEYNENEKSLVARS